MKSIKVKESVETLKTLCIEVDNEYNMVEKKYSFRPIKRSSNKTQYDKLQELYEGRAMDYLKILCQNPHLIKIKYI